MKNKDKFNLNFIWFTGLRHEELDEVDINIKLDEKTIGSFSSDLCPKCILTKYNKWLESEE